MLKKTLIICVLVCFACGIAIAEESRQVGDINSGSKAGEVHNLNLYDETGIMIRPGSDSADPLSLKRTCVICHDYGKIVDGWHFNQTGMMLDENGQIIQGDSGRNGEPWIYWDAMLAVQIPLSYRGWEGTFKPSDIGLSDWEFTKIFGRHMPGGGVAVKGDMTVTAPGDKWEISGDYETNCFVCHSDSAGQNPAECANQLIKGNFQWATAAGSETASVSGEVAYIPKFSASPQDHPSYPKIDLQESAFGNFNKVTLELKKEVSAERCYFCHSNKHLGGDMDDDVHMKAGLTCVDCHSNGTDHMITRGYEGEAGAEKVTCAGCHLGVEGSEKPSAGRLGAPYPQHVGIPTVHFDKLSCTSCHSGPWPGEETSGVKTSRAHSMGLHTTNYSDDTLPHIQWPVFVTGADGKLTPSKLMWPAYWGVLKDDKVTPLPIDMVAEVTEGILPFKNEMSTDGDWKIQSGRGDKKKDVKSLTDEKVALALTAFAAKELDGEPVYIAGGKLRKVEGSRLAIVNHDAAKAYTWPIAHNVRGAKQSLGVRKCKDCHRTDAAFTFGSVKVDSPLISDEGVTIEMSELQDVDAKRLKLFAMTFVFRPMMKLVGLGASALISLVILLYVLKALGGLISLFASKKE